MVGCGVSNDFEIVHCGFSNSFRTVCCAFLNGYRMILAPALGLCFSRSLSIFSGFEGLNQYNKRKRVKYGVAFRL